MTESTPTAAKPGPKPKAARTAASKTAAPKTGAAKPGPKPKAATKADAKPARKPAAKAKPAKTEGTGVWAKAGIGAAIGSAAVAAALLYTRGYKPKKPEQS